MDSDRLLSTAEVAARKGCTPMAVRNAIARGDLAGRRVGPVWVVTDDDALAAWSVKETGGRVHRQRAATAEDDGS